MDLYAAYKEKAVNEGKCKITHNFLGMINSYSIRVGIQINKTFHYSSKSQNYKRL